MGSVDHVVDHEAPTDGGPAAASVLDVIDFLDFDRRNVAVLRESSRDWLNFAPPIGRIGGDRDVLAPDDQIGRSDVPGRVVVSLRHWHRAEIARRGAGLDPFADQRDLLVAQRGIVLVMLDADVFFDVPRRHHSGVWADRRPLADRARPGAHVIVGDQRHGRDPVVTVARDATALENRRDVARKRDPGRGRRRAFNGDRQPDETSGGGQHRHAVAQCPDHKAPARAPSTATLAVPSHYTADIV